MLAPVEIAKLVYWSMIESGLALIAACLPSLNHWIRNLSSKAFTRHARETVSSNYQRSVQLQYPLKSKRPIINHGVDEQGVLGSHSGGSGRLGNVETHAMADVESQKDILKHEELPMGAIVVRSDVSCSAELRREP